MNYDILLFDCDGVMIPQQYLFTDRLQVDYGIDVVQMQPFFRGVFKQCTLGNADLREELKTVIGGWGWKGTVDELVEYWLTIGTEVDRGMIDFVHQCVQKGYRCFMVTEQEKNRGECLRAMLGSGKVFEEVYYSSEIGFGKKEFGFYAHVYNAINRRLDEPTSKDRFLLIDDGPPVLEKAMEFGFGTYRFGNLEELKSLLDK